MSTNCDGVRNNKILYNYQDQNTKQVNDNRVSNALSTGNVGTQVAEKLNEETKQKSKREENIEEVAKHYNLTPQLIKNFIEKAMGVKSIEELNDDQFYLILDGVFTSALEIAKEKNNKYNIKKIEDYSKKYNSLILKGFGAEEARNFLCDYNGMSVSKLISINFSPEDRKKYANLPLSEIPQNVIEESIRTIVEKHSINKKNNGVNKIQAFKSLLKNTSDKDFDIIFNIFIKVLSEKDEKFAMLVKQIKEFEANPEKFDEFINNKISTLITDDADQNIIRETLKNIKDIFEQCKNPDGSINMKEAISILLDKFNPEKILADIQTKIDKNEELNEQEQKTYDFLTRCKQIKEKKKNGIELTDDEKKFITAHEQKMENIKKSLFAALSENKSSDDLKIIIEEANRFGINTEDLLKEIALYQEQFEDFKIDSKSIDAATNGEYTKIISKEINNSQIKDTDNTSSVALGFANRAIEPTLSSNITNTLKNLYNQTQEEENYVIAKDKDNDIVSPYQKYSAVEKLSASEIFEGIAKKYIKIGEVIDKYDELSQSGKDFVNKMVEIMSQGQQNYFLNGIKNSIVLAIVRHTNIDPSKLKLSLDHDAQQEIDKIMEEKEKARGQAV